MSLRRGEIVYADFSCYSNSCIQAGIRPAVIISNNRSNEHSTIITVVPLSSRIEKKIYLPTHGFIQQDEQNMLPKDSIFLGEQLGCIDINRIVLQKGTISNEKMRQLTKAAQIQIGVYEIYN